MLGDYRTTIGEQKETKIIEIINESQRISMNKTGLTVNQKLPKINFEKQTAKLKSMSQ